MAEAAAHKAEVERKQREAEAIKKAQDEARNAGAYQESNSETAVTKNAADDFANIGQLPDLGKSEVIPIDLMTDYWSPEKVGEFKNLFFNKIGVREVADKNTGEAFELTCAYFFERGEDGSAKQITNGSVRLVTALQRANCERLTPFRITYMGKQRNTTNSNMSDSWKVEPLKINL